MLKTLKMTVSYQGTAYCGWQIQSNGPSIQSRLESALATVTQQTVRVTGSGRTDSGVHAIAQVASCRVATDLGCQQLVRAVNANLPEDIRIHRMEQVPDEFHAIYWAKRKRYRYIWQDAEIGDVFRRDYTWHVFKELDAPAMHRVGQTLVGEHDFASFQSAGSERATTIRTVYELSVQRCRQRPGEVVMEIQANGFLYNMVRNIAGTLREVGQGKGDALWLRQILEARDRRAAGMTAPARGLYLVHVDYA